ARFDRLVLANEAAQRRPDRLGTGLELGIGQHLVWVDSESRNRAQGKEHREQQSRAAPHSAASGTGSASATSFRRGTPTRSRRSVSDRKPANAMIRAPNQMKVTKGLNQMRTT